MLDRVNEEKLKKIITVGFSNNGVAVYQHLSQLVLRGQGPGGLEVMRSEVSLCRVMRLETLMLD